jgi:hypothetical protein
MQPTSIRESIMHPHLRGLAALLAGGALALPALAQNMKAGLWEVSNRIGSPDGRLQAAMARMQQQMAQLDPAQRKTLQQMMAKQGVELDDPAGGAIRARMCVTPEMAARNDLPVQQQGSCTHTRSPLRGDTMKIAFTCSEPRASGEGELSFSGDTAYRVRMKVTSAARGQDETITMDGSGKWLGADCGAVKPFAMPQAGPAR